MTETAVAVPLKGPAMPVPMSDEKAAVLSMIERAARDPSVDIDKLERLMTMQRQMAAERAKMEYDAAMAACQAEMEPIRRDADNAQTKSKYATYAALDRALRPIYTSHGFAVTFDTSEAKQTDYIMVHCIIAHKGGHERTHKAPMACDGKGAKGGDVMTKTHAIGSALMYGRRYTLGLGFNIVTADMKDDDGNRAGDTGETINETQEAELKKRIEAVGSDIIEFCTYFKLDKVSDLKLSQLERANKALDGYQRGRK
jgi:hypothetical protein